jgi:hypothetical protein
MAHSFKAGDRVVIINQKMSGLFVLEGEAEILKPIHDVDEQYVVRFGFGSYTDTVERFVDPAAQSDPAAFVARLNQNHKA